MHLIRYGLTVSIATIALAFGCKASLTTGSEAAAPSATPVAATPPPPVDTDGDGIPDDKDACKDKAGTANEDAAKNGCPAEAPKLMAAPVQKVEVVGNEIKIKEKIMFDLSSRPSSRRATSSSTSLRRSSRRRAATSTSSRSAVTPISRATRRPT